MPREGLQWKAHSPLYNTQEAGEDLERKARPVGTCPEKKEQRILILKFVKKSPILGNPKLPNNLIFARLFRI